MPSSNISNKLSGIFSPSVAPGQATSAQNQVTPPIQSVQSVQATQPANQVSDQTGDQSNGQSSVSVDAALQEILAKSSSSPTQTSVPTQVSASVQIPSPSDQTSGQTAPTDLDLLEEMIDQAEQTVPQALPTAMMQVADQNKAAETSQQIGHSGGGKETAGVTVPDNSVVEAGGSVQFVEYEPNAELSPEVEGYINRVEQNADQAPHEIVIADSSMPMPANHQLPSQPVIVLPITPEIEKQGATKSPKFSIRWLVEWSRKIIKTFVGKVIYRQV